jgi:hypothetical protein
MQLSMKIMSSLTMRSSTMSDKWHRRPNSSTSSNYSVRRSPRTQQINSSPVLRPERYFFSHDTQAWSEKKRVEALTREVVRRHPWANQMRSTKLKNVRIARGSLPTSTCSARPNPSWADRLWQTFFFGSLRGLVHFAPGDDNVAR